MWDVDHSRILLSKFNQNTFSNWKLKAFGLLATQSTCLNKKA